MPGSWLTQLPTSHVPVDVTPTIGDDAERVRAQLGDRAVRWSDTVGHDMACRITDEVPSFGTNVAHFRLIRRGTTSTVLRSLLLFQGLAPDIITTEALDVARDLARRGQSMTDIFRAVRAGQACMIDAMLQVVAAADAPGSSTEMQRVSRILLHEFNAFASAIEAEFKHEYESGIAVSAARRIQTINKVLDGDIDPGAASRALGYPLEQRHVGVVAWSTAEPSPVEDATVRKAVSAVLTSLEAHRSLRVPVGTGAVWAWGTVPDPSRLQEAGSTALPPDVDVAVGQVGAGVEGFRSTHAEARAVERLVMLGGPRSKRSGVTLHEDASLAVLMAADVDAARVFLRRTLGQLLAEEPRTRETRATLRCYLDQGRSLARTAEKLRIARNTVTYRVHRAEELSGHSVSKDHLLLHAALVLQEYIAVPPDDG